MLAGFFPAMTWLGLDIGGANLKAADGRGWARSVPFALWRKPNELPQALAEIIADAPAASQLAVTMTGELADCFRTKAEGVRHILAAVREAAAGREVRVYLVDGRLASLGEACESPQLAAASNWHVLAQFACRFVDGRSAVLIDIGSTTTDIIPLADGRPSAGGWNDTDRLLAGELVYTGVGRTPLCAVTHELPWQAARCPIAAELFATTADAYVLLGELPERPNCLETADGRPLTKEFARERLARMICADAATFSDEDAIRAAAHVRDCQVAAIGDALRAVAGASATAFETFITSGQGEFLARRVIAETTAQARLVSLSEQLGPETSACAPAHAVAALAREWCERHEQS